MPNLHLRHYIKRKFLDVSFLIWTKGLAAITHI
jgi:hypothetical protein